jgi:hypothetical protein
MKKLTDITTLQILHSLLLGYNWKTKSSSFAPQDCARMKIAKAQKIKEERKT